MRHQREYVVVRAEPAEHGSQQRHLMVAEWLGLNVIEQVVRGLVSRVSRAHVLQPQAHRARRVQVLMPPAFVPAQGSAEQVVPGHDVIECGR